MQAQKIRSGMRPGRWRYARQWASDVHRTRQRVKQERAAQCALTLRAHLPELSICVATGRGLTAARVVEGEIIDRGVRIPEGLVVGENEKLDALRFRRTEAGICLITQAMIDKLDQ